MSDISIQDVSIQNRKFAKTCVEKKRRDRINKCLDELKNLMAQSDDKARFQKLEKAEILEMAVNYMKSLRQQNGNSTQSSSSSTTLHDTDNYLNAYKQCFTDFQQYLTETNMENEFKSRLVNHMTQRFTNTIKKRYQNDEYSYNSSKRIKLNDSYSNYDAYPVNIRTSSPSDESSFTSSSSSSCSSPISSLQNTTHSFSVFNLQMVNDLQNSKMWRPW